MNEDVNYHHIKCIFDHDERICHSSFDKQNQIPHNQFRKKKLKKYQQNSKTFRAQKLPSINQQKYKIKPNKQSYIDKKVNQLFADWKKYYFVLTHQKLYMYQTELKENLLSCINFKLLTPYLSCEGNKIHLDFNKQCQSLCLRFTDERQLSEWKQQLTKVINKNQQKLRLKTVVRSIYQGKDCISQDDFLQVVETGDILLFRSENTSSQLQRFLTNSQYDHIAMLVKPTNQDPMVFESNMNFGVCLYDWKQYIRYFDRYEKVAFRKLHCSEREKKSKKLLEFVKKNKGKKYELNARKILRLQSDFDWNSLNEDERGYFCSELVAKAYKGANLVEERKSCGRYWPVHFTTKKSVLLEKGAWLGSQQIVILNKHLKKRV